MKSTANRLAHITRRAASTAHTVRASYEITLAAIHAGLPGDLVECGVFLGANAAAMALAVMDSGERRAIHLFDSFEGIPQCGPKDLEFVAAGHGAGLSAASLEQVKKHFDEWGVDQSLIAFHAGWFADTLPSAAIDQIAVLRLDGDIYESTKVCMEHLYPKVVPGGWVIVDDFHLSGCREAVNEFCNPGPAYFQRHD